MINLSISLETTDYELRGMLALIRELLAERESPAAARDRGSGAGTALPAQAAAPGTETICAGAIIAPGARADKPAPATPPAANPAPTAPAIPAQTPPPAVPVQTPQYTITQLANAARGLLDQGKADLAALQGLLQQFGVAAMNALTPEQYGAFAAALRGLGASL